MDKNTFLLKLEKRLKGLPEEDLQKTLDYYREIIDDRMEDGLSEEAAVADIGSIEEIAEPLLPKSSKRKMKAWEITLLILGFPVWFPLLIAAAAIVFSLLVSIYAVCISLAGCAVGGVFCILIYLMQANWAGAAFIFGASLVCGGLAVLCLLGSNWLVKTSFRGLKNTFRKGN